MAFNITALNHVAVNVSDSSRARDFYVDVMGFQEVESQEGNADVKWMKTPDGKLVHLLVPPPGIDTRHVAFTVEDFEEALDEIKEQELEIVVGPDARDDGERYVFFKDTEGNIVELAGH